MSHTRSLMVVAIFLLSMGASVGCAPKDAAMDAKIVQIGSTKADLFGMPPEYRALHVRLEKCFDRRVIFTPQPDGPAIAKQLELGNLSYALMSAKEYGQIEDPGKLTLLATAVNKSGKTARKAFILTRTGSGAKAIPDCKGKRFAFGTYQDLLTDFAVQKALEDAGLPVKDLFPDLLTPPPLGLEGRLYLGDDAAKKMLPDLTVEAGVMDETVYDAMPASGGNLITGPSKDQFRVLGETMAVPELVVVAGPSADPALTEKLKDDLLNKVKDDPNVCQQLGVKGFAAPDQAGYDAARKLAPKPKQG